MEPLSLAASNRYCAQAARRSRSSFYLSFWLLSRQQRKAMCALYTFARNVDDIVDDAVDAAEARPALNQWRAMIESILESDEGGNAWQSHLQTEAAGSIMPALAAAIQEFAIPPKLCLELIDGVEMDLLPMRLKTYTELESYCYHVAVTVGIACLHIWGHDEDGAQSPAMSCGLALQLTNILRDLREDADRDRCYLPAEELARFDYTFDDLKAGVCDDRFRRLMKFQIDRAAGFYEEATALYPKVNSRGRRMLKMMLGAYRGLLNKIEANIDQTLTQRVRLTPLEKLRAAVK